MSDRTQQWEGTTICDSCGDERDTAECVHELDPNGRPVSFCPDCVAAKTVTDRDLLAFNRCLAMED